MVASRFPQLLSLQQVPFLGDDQHGAEFIPANLVKADVNSQFQCAHQVERATEHQPLLRSLRGVQPVERLVAAPMPFLVRSVGAQARIAQFVAPQRPMHQEPEGRIIGPLPR